MSWFDHYIVHFGAWTSSLAVMNIYKNGLPSSLAALRDNLLMTALVALLLALPSSKAHMHYNAHIATIVAGAAK